MIDFIYVLYYNNRILFANENSNDPQQNPTCPYSA